MSEYFPYAGQPGYGQEQMTSPMAAALSGGTYPDQRGFNNNEGSQFYLIHDNTPPNYNAGPNVNPNIATASGCHGGAWPENGHNGYSYNSYVPDMGGYSSPYPQQVWGQNMSQPHFNMVTPILTDNGQSQGIPSQILNLVVPGKRISNGGRRGSKIRGQEKKGHNDEFSEKLVAFARYNRNNTLIKEVFSDAIIPKTFVTTKRLETLQEQVRLLEKHHKTKELELASVEHECTERKRKFMESTEEFKTEYEILCRPVVGVKNYSEMFLKHYNYYKAEAERQKWEQTLAWAHQTVAASEASANGNSIEIDVEAD